MAEYPRIYSRRPNSESSFDSVCPDCLRIISSERVEVNLAHAEKNHYCDPFLLDLLWGKKRFFN